MENILKLLIDPIREKLIGYELQIPELEIVITGMITHKPAKNGDTDGRKAHTH